MSNFMSSMQNTLVNSDHNVAMSENGALGYETTGKALLDLNFSVASMRKWDEQQIAVSYMRAFSDNPELAIKWLFFSRDVRGGLGERRLFRIIFNHMANYHTKAVSHLVPHIAEYGRWDDIVCLLSTRLSGVAFDLIKNQLKIDRDSMIQNQPISLLAKWLPSINTSSKTSVKLARGLAKGLDISERQYRKMLSSMRKYIDVIEVKMSSKNWGDINYQRVPSKANLLYSKAFLKNDEDRRTQFLDALEKGEAKINAGTLYPHDIVHKYLGGYNHRRSIEVDQTLEGLWKALPNTVDPNSRTMVVADGSGSMDTAVGKDGNVTALEVANALAIYFAERLSGEFRNKYITFSSRPQFVNFDGCSTLVEKLAIASRYNEVSNTNVAAVFALILETAVRCHMKQEEMPTNIRLISDMEFDSCGGRQVDERLFDIIQREYQKFGYKVPRLVFWNVNSRSGMIPVIKNDLGVALVSGFSVNIANMVMSGKTDPYDCLVETLMSDRYAPITLQA